MKYGLTILLLAAVMLVTGSRGMILSLVVSLLFLNVPARKLRVTRSRGEQRLVRGITLACLLAMSVVIISRLPPGLATLYSSAESPAQARVRPAIALTLSRVPS